MRLVSKFKDYYDSLQDPTDKHHVYVRMPLFLKPDDPVSQEMRLLNRGVPDFIKWGHDRRLGQNAADIIAREWNGAVVPKLAMKQGWGHGSSNTPDAAFTTEFVLFCGKLYRGVRYTERWEGLRGPRNDSSWNPTDATVSRVWWSQEAFEADTVADPGRDKVLSDDKNKILKAFMDKAFAVETSNALMDIHFKTGCPVISVDYDPAETDRHRKQLVAVLNPCLNEMQFYRTMPAPLAFQELSMFIGGVLSNNDRPEPIDNKYKILAHGFDLKDSFRKGPTKTHT